MAPIRRRHRIWLPIVGLALVLMLAAGVGIARLTGIVVDPIGVAERASGLTFTDLDEVVTVHTPRGWWDDSPAEAGQLDSDGLYQPSLVVMDGMTTIVVWIFPTIPTSELTDAHSENLDDACDVRDCATPGSSRAATVDDRPALSSTVTSTDDGDDLIAVITTVIAPRHLVLIEIEGYTGDITAADLDGLLAGITIDR